MNASDLIDLVVNAIRFIILLGVLVFVHELGHFLVAKLTNVYVVTLSLGFGKRVFGFKKGETDYRVSAIPLGGYVKMVGQEDIPKTQEEAELADPEIRNVPPERRFDTQPFWKKLSISLAGPAMNLLFALPIFWVVYMIGLNVPIYSQYTRIGSVEPNSPAARAGIKPGESILSINGDPVKNWEQVQLDILTNRGRPLRMELKDLSGNIEQATVVPARTQDSSRATIGIEPLLNDVVNRVLPNSPGEQGGLKAGDVILTYNNEPVDNETMKDLIKAIHQSAGQPMVFTVLRNDRLTNVTIVPEEVRAISGVDFAGNIVASVHKEEANPAALELKPGDTVVALNGAPVKKGNLDDLVEKVPAASETVKLAIRRGTGLFGKPTEFSVAVPLSMKGRIGVVFSPFVFKQFGPGESFVKSFGAYGESFGLTMESLYYLVTGRVSTKEMAGPIGIAVYTTESLKLGIGYYLKLVAFITINLGIINLLPIPILDGGLILLAIIELVRRKPLEEKYLILFQRIGLAFLLFLVLIATYNDILRAINYFLGHGFME